LCDRNAYADPHAAVVLTCVERASPYRFVANGVGIFSGPRAGRTFTGGYVWISDQAATAAWKVTCDAKLGGRLEWVSGGLAFVGGVRLRPIIRRYHGSVDVSGTRYAMLVTCGWRIPHEADGNFLSLVHPPEDLENCDVDCRPWGVHFEFGAGGGWECNQTTWRVRSYNAPIGPDVKTMLAC